MAVAVVAELFEQTCNNRFLDLDLSEEAPPLRSQMLEGAVPWQMLPGMQSLANQRLLLASRDGAPIVNPS